MRKLRQVLSAALAAILAGCLASALFWVMAGPFTSSSPLLLVINVIILSIVIVAVCAVGVLHYFSTCRNEKPQNAVKLSSTPMWSHSHAEITSDCPESDLCSICLSHLVDELQVVRMTCCSNMLHQKCLQQYIHSLASALVPNVPCVYCRARLY